MHDTIPIIFLFSLLITKINFNFYYKISLILLYIIYVTKI